MRPPEWREVAEPPPRPLADRWNHPGNGNAGVQASYVVPRFLERGDKQNEPWLLVVGHVPKHSQVLVYKPQKCSGPHDPEHPDVGGDKLGGVKKRALIVAAPEAVPGRPLNGTVFDLLRWQNFLFSPRGGAWHPHRELSLVFDPTGKTLRRHLAWVGEADLAYVVFSGHGYTDRRLDALDALRLMAGPDLEIGLKQLLPLRASWSVTVVDACRNLVPRLAPRYGSEVGGLDGLGRRPVYASSRAQAVWLARAIPHAAGARVSERPFARWLAGPRCPRRRSCSLPATIPGGRVRADRRLAKLMRTEN